MGGVMIESFHYPFLITPYRMAHFNPKFLSDFDIIWLVSD